MNAFNNDTVIEFIEASKMLIYLFFFPPPLCQWWNERKVENYFLEVSICLLVDIYQFLLWPH